MKKGMMVLCMCCAMLSFGQKTLDKLLKQQNKETIPYIHVNALKSIKKQVLLLDARETKEYNTSHIKDAICVGYDFFNLDTIQKTDSVHAFSPAWGKWLKNGIKIYD
jgi:3-mercaptopyruvate sulfurtransferase SseA